MWKYLIIIFVLSSPKPIEPPEKTNDSEFNIFVENLTGASEAAYRIVPFGYDHRTGNVLCKTYHFLNEMGGRVLLPERFGWLIVNKDGTWEEHVHADLPGEFGGLDWEEAEALHDQYGIEFNNDFDWQDIPESLEPLLEGNHYNEAAYMPSKDLFFYTADGIYNGLDDLLFKDVEMNCLYGLKPDGQDVFRVSCSYYIDGVAFFDCYSSYGEISDEAYKVGPTFFADMYEYGISIYDVTGICFLTSDDSNE